MMNLKLGWLVAIAQLVWRLLLDADWCDSRRGFVRLEVSRMWGPALLLLFRPLVDGSI
jgi:hypothetical protein